MASKICWNCDFVKVTVPSFGEISVLFDQLPGFTSAIGTCLESSPVGRTIAESSVEDKTCFESVWAHAQTQHFELRDRISPFNYNVHLCLERGEKIQIY